MSEDNPMILSPGINAASVWAIQNSPRAKIAHHFYSVATGIKNRAGAFVGFALTDSQLEELVRLPEVRGREIGRAFFKQFSQDSGSVQVGRFILVGTETDMFLDILAGISVKPGYQKTGEIVTPHAHVPAKEINTKKEGERW